MPVRLVFCLVLVSSSRNPQVAISVIFGEPSAVVNRIFVELVRFRARAGAKGFKGFHSYRISATHRGSDSIVPCRVFRHVERLGVTWSPVGPCKWPFFVVLPCYRFLRVTISVNHPPSAYRGKRFVPGVVVCQDAPGN